MFCTEDGPAALRGGPRPFLTHYSMCTVSRPGRDSHRSPPQVGKRKVNCLISGACRKQGLERCPHPSCVVHKLDTPGHLSGSISFEGQQGRSHRYPENSGKKEHTLSAMSQPPQLNYFTRFNVFIF